MTARALLLGVVLLLAGCGGGTGSKGLSHDELVQQADAICADAQKREAAIPRASKDSEVAREETRRLGVARVELAKLAALEPSEDDAGDYRALLGGFRRTLGFVTQARDAAAAGNAPRHAVFTSKAVRASIELGPVARRLGLKVCASAR